MSEKVCDDDVVDEKHLGFMPVRSYIFPSQKSLRREKSIN